MLTFIVLVALISGQHLATGIALDPSTCINQTREPLDKMIAYTGWPFKFNCSILFTNTSESLNTQCFYSSSGDRNFTSANQHIVSPTTTPALQNYEIVLEINEGFCLRKTVVVEIKQISNRSCYDDAVYHVARDDNVVHKRVKDGTRFRLDCFPDASTGEERIFPPSLPNTEYETQWFRSVRYSTNLTINPERSCLPYPKYFTSVIHKDNSNSVRPTAIDKYWVNYFDPGVYSCQVTYNGITANIVHYSICVETEVPKNIEPSILCTKRTPFQEAEVLALKCSVTIPNGKIDPDELKISWSKEVDGEGYCTNANLSIRDKSSVDSRITCGIEGFKNNELKCFEFIPEIGEQIQHRQDERSFSAYFNQTNLRKSDAGWYILRVTYKGRNSVFRMEVVYHPQKDLETHIKALVALIIIIIILALVVTFMWYNRIQIRLFLRRHYGKFDEDGKENVAILSYYFSTELDEDTRTHTKKILSLVKDQMKKMDYSFYDCNQSRVGGGNFVEGLLRKIDESHRMIIVLTDSYVNDSWSRFEAQQGYTSMLKNRTKLIVIRTPGVKSALKKVYQKQDDFSKELREIVKASRNISWKKNMADSRFQDCIQYALPKLRRDGFA
ncbi:uncharacterized protein LOC143459062 [Clavelina lepadiformis]|uniref:uncharacterized protein LOC143459062 n=1 Tax=Clavelina lepadiformis TaxID=159417 RepID=UPI0040415E3A